MNPNTDCIVGIGLVLNKNLTLDDYYDNLDENFDSNFKLNIH